MLLTQVDDLRRDGLVVLGLSSAQYRQLGMLREATASLSASLDALRYDRCVSTGLGLCGLCVRVCMCTGLGGRGGDSKPQSITGCPEV
jgi:ferredoxin